MSGRPGMMLGCHPRKPGVKAPLLMAKYLRDLPPAPEKVYREYRIPEDAWGMFGNNDYGDCTMACLAHMLMLITAHTGKIVIPDEQDIIKTYFSLTGGEDTGLDLPTVLNYWRDTGIAGHKIEQWADIDPQNIENQKHGIHIFGATDDAIQIPVSAMDQFETGKSWEILPDDGGIDGGHSIPRFGYGSQGFSCVTWAKNQKGNTGWWLKYLMESCVVLTSDWIKNADGLTPSGFNLDALMSDLNALKA